MNLMQIWSGAKSRDSKWMEQMLALNPWASGLIGSEDNEEFKSARQKASRRWAEGRQIARGLSISDDDEEFQAERQKATLERWARGRQPWNDWANAMLALRKELQKAGEWSKIA